MKNIFDMQSEFMAKAGQCIDASNKKQIKLYQQLIFEESDEFYNAQDKDEQIKECCDLLVVASGFLITLLGAEKSKKAYEIVHASNMAKLVGNIERREDGKILKDKSWSENIKIKLMTDISLLLD